MDSGKLYNLDEGIAFPTKYWSLLEASDYLSGVKICDWELGYVRKVIVTEYNVSEGFMMPVLKFKKTNISGKGAVECYIFYRG